MSSRPMRYVYSLLIATNFLFLLWNIAGSGQSGSDGNAHAPALAQQGLPSLVLLREAADPTGQSADKAEHVAGQHAAMAAAETQVATGEGQQAVAAQPQQADAQPTLICKSLGPFDEQADARRVSDRLAGMGLSPVLRSMDSRVVDDYWVYVPGKGKDYSSKVVRQLKEHRINDFYVFDNYDYMISLGAFRSESHAEDQLKALRSIGLKAVLEQRYRTRTQHWLEVAVTRQHDAQLRDIVQETPGLELATDTCTSLAKN